MTKKFSSCLVAPLDWGLGHAARCVPLIQELLQRNIKVHVACSHTQSTFFSAEFPSLPLLLLDPPGIRYSPFPSLQVPYLFFQVLKRLPQEFAERRMLRTYMHEHGLEVLISDSRPLLLQRAVPCIYISHQIHVPSGLTGILSTWLQLLCMRRALCTWIPDHAHLPGSMAGGLSHPAPTANHAYIGPLSRWQVFSLPANPRKHLLVLLSGPEPLRTHLEKKLLVLLRRQQIPYVLVRGSLHAPALPEEKEADIYPLADSGDLQKLFSSCRGVISRGGYSSVMDQQVLGIPWLMIPTNGQPEQEYLARQVKHAHGITWVNEQDLPDFDLYAWWKQLPETAATKNPGITGVLKDQLSTYFTPKA